jgi:ABC-type multidrug transport system fused ATPase/permease subunit
MALVGVSFAHPGAAPGVPDALNDVTLRFESGEVSVLVGPVGSGKSTVLRLLAGLTRPSSGEVYVAGYAYSAVGLRAARHLVGYMPQEAVLFDRTAGENLLYGAPEDATAEGAVALAESLGLWAALSPGLPQGLDTPVGKNGSRLSGGQRQLMWLLRLAIRDPPFLVLDEPTASMDAATRDALVVALGHLVHREGRRATVIMATHDPALASFATKVVNVGLV